MKKYLYILLLCLSVCGTSAQSYRSSLDNAIDIGTYSDFFSYDDTRSTSGYSDIYTHRFYNSSTNTYYTEPPARDVFYKLTITNKSMQLQINDYGSSFVYGTRIYILDANGYEIAYCKPYDLAYPPFMYSLQPGTYYIVVEAATETRDLNDIGTIAIQVEAVAKPIADDFFYPAVLGTFNSDFSSSNTLNDHSQNSFIDDYTCDFKDGSEVDADASRYDLVHQFTITKTMDITIDNIGSAGLETTAPHFSYLRMLSSSKDTIPEESIEYIEFSKRYHYELPPGTYYIYSKFSMNGYIYGRYVLNVAGKEQLVGSSVFNPIDVGKRSDSFTYTNTQNTDLFNKSTDNAKPGKEVYYKFELTVPMELTVDNCGSVVSDTYMRLLSESKNQLYDNDTYTGTGACSNTHHAYIKAPVLLPGTYYIETDGAQDGNISTTISGITIGPMGDRLATAIDFGKYDAGFQISDTKNTAAEFADQFTGKPTNDIFYKFTLNHAVDVTVSHCGSAVTDTYMSLLDANGSVIYSNDNYTGNGACNNTGNAVIKVEQLAAGTYYVVSEGNTQNGNITTTIEARSRSSNIQTTQGQPHIISIIPTVETDSVALLSNDQLRRSVQYFNNFGYPTVNVELDAVPYGGDRVTLQETDGFFRKSKEWLPIAKTTDGGQYSSPEQIQLQAKNTALYAGDQRPYSQTIYDGSPMDMVVKQYGPGDDWFNNNRSVKTDRMTNLGSSGVLACAKYVRNGSSTAPTIIKNGFYADNELYVTRTTDEDNRISYEFKDKAGRMLLSRKMDGTVQHDTYYIYDSYGNLSFVLPPLASDELTAINTAWDESTPTVTKYCYVYIYDAYNRCISKRLPGCEPIYSIYDKADRLICTQDGNQRAKPIPEWTFTLPDVFGRTVLTGKCTDNLAYLNNPLSDVLVKATYTGGTNAFKGYTVSGLSLTSPTILSVNYYDNYAFLNTNGITDGGFILQGQIDTSPYMDAKGFLTGSLTAQLEPEGVVNSEYLYSVKYYDNRGRFLQVADKVEAGTSRVTYSYDFVGNPLFVLEQQSVQGLQTEILTAYTYDQVGRQLSETVSVNGTEQTSVTNSYDQIGRLTGTKLAKGLWSDSETLRYNIRSWLSEKSGSNFSMSLRYNDALSPASDRLYSGNISEWTWHHGSGTDNMYSFGYDGLGRLTESDQYTSSGSGWTPAVSPYTEKEISYDKNGNILTLQRMAAGNMVDNLSYTYNGNRLSALDESVLSAGAGDLLVRGNSAQGTYDFDSNGNHVYDSRKGLTYGYNFLNLTDNVKEGQTVRASYKWSASGAKLGVRDGTGGYGFDYVGPVVYSRNGGATDVDAINFSHGVIRKQSNGYMVNYFLRDHLGSTRVVLDGNGAVLEQNDYYPFGARHKNNDYLASDNRYRYNGKEEQVVGNVGLMDYGARFYDPVIGRWNVVDPMAEKFYSLNPYNYTDDNPVNNTDPTGMETLYGDAAKVAFIALKNSRQGNNGDDDDDKKKPKEKPYEQMSSEEKRIHNEKARQYQNDLLLPFNEFMLEARMFGMLVEDAMAVNWSKTGNWLKSLFTGEASVAKTGSWAKTSGILRDAVKGKGNYGLGSGTYDEAMQAGRSWVGEGFTISKDGSSWISSNGLRQFRPPSFKPKLNIEQANFQWRNINKGAWQSNGHLDIIKP